MSGTQITSDGLTVRQRKILFRSWHRGTREMDLLMGGFADKFLAELSSDHLSDFEQLIEVPDWDLFAWITGTRETPNNYATPVFSALQAFHLKGTDAARAYL
ncbi:MAG: succinate dehydrogenase assembly factor 2 [Pseudomonadota bacterium]